MNLELDYKIKDINKRKEIVDNICAEYGNELSNINLEQLANYLVLEGEEKEERRILTPNRRDTIRKRETSFEGMVSKFECNKDGIYNIMNEDKNTILSPKSLITKDEIESIPFIKQLRESIDRLKEIPERNYIIQQAIINLGQTQYIIKNSYRQPMESRNNLAPEPSPINWNKIVNFEDWEVVKHFCRSYSSLKSEHYNDIHSYTYWLLDEFEGLFEEALSEEPMLYDILIGKFNGLTNIEIRKQLKENHGDTYSIEYISSLFNNKIPKLIAREAEKESLIYHYTFVERGEWKTCSKCNQVKLAHSIFFSKNRSGEDGFYSICKECRNTKGDVE